MSRLGPPRPSMEDFTRPATLERYGVDHRPDRTFTLERMADGYWTPWHVAERKLAELRALLAKATRGAKRLGAAGGKARADKLTPERRSEIARQAANARWSTVPANPKVRIRRRSAAEIHHNLNAASTMSSCRGDFETCPVGDFETCPVCHPARTPRKSR